MSKNWAEDKMIKALDRIAVLSNKVISRRFDDAQKSTPFFNRNGQSCKTPDQKDFFLGNRL